MPPPSFRKICLPNGEIILCKGKPQDNRDNFITEISAGLIINKLNMENFVRTHGYTEDEVYLNYVPGPLLSKFKGPFEIMLNYVLQVLLATEIAYEKYGFTHYNLHRNNIIIRPVKRRKLTYRLKDGNVHLYTDGIATIIDFGRSYTDVTGGHTLEESNVYPKPNRFHDIYFFLHSALSRTYPDELREILSWYNVPVSLSPCRDIFKYTPKLISGKTLVRKCQKRFNL